RISQNAYERVRREFTASAARRALRSAYQLLSERFLVPDLDAVEEAPKMELLSDDDFEATVFEEAPAPPHVDTALNKLHPLEEALQSLSESESESTGTTSSESVIAPPPPREPDETVERAPVPPPRDPGGWTVSALAAPP